MKLALFLLLAPLFSVSLRAQTGPGTALNFNGVNQVVQIGGPTVSPPWTAEFWVNRQNASGTSAILLYGTSSALKLEQYNGTRKVGFTQYGVADYPFNYTAPIGEWVHLAFVSTTTNTQLYVNGNMQDATNATIALQLGQIGGDTTLSHGANYMNGTLDEVRIWSVARSQEQIQTNMNRSLSLPQPNLVAYWRFDEGSGIYAHDSGTNGITGTLVNGPIWDDSTVPFLPFVTTESATAITTNSATLNETVFPDGSATVAWIQWGTTSNYGTYTTSTILTNFSNPTNAFPVQIPVTGLTPGITYHYQGFASNSAGVVAGGDQTFETMPIYPIHAEILLARLFQEYDGTPKPIGVSTIPAGLNVIVTYDGTTNAPIDAGAYQVSATISDTNYAGAADDFLLIIPSRTPAEMQVFDSPTNVFIYDELATTRTTTTVSVQANHPATFGPVRPMVVGAPQNELSCQWVRNGVNIPGATNVSYTVPEAQLTDNGATYLCSMTVPGASLNSVAWTLSVIPDVTPPEVQSIDFDESGTNKPLTVTVTYSELMNTQSVLSVSNYVFTGGAISGDVVLNPDGRSVSFSMTPYASSNGQYSLLVIGGADLAGNLLTTSNGLAGIIPFTSTNLAVQGFASQSSTNSGEGADRAIDGNTDGIIEDGSVAANQPPETNGWWEVDLGGAKYLGRIHLWFCTDCASNMQDNFTVKVLDSQRNAIWSETYPGRPPTDIGFNLPRALLGQFVRFEAPFPPIDNGAFSLAEVEVFSSYETNVARPAVPKLFASIVGTNAQLSWRGQGTLQSASSLAGPWLSQTNASSPYNFSYYGTNGPVFYRIINTSPILDTTPIIVIDSVDPPFAWPDETVNVSYTLINNSLSTISGSVDSYVTRDYLTRVLTGPQQTISVPGLGSVPGTLQLSTWVDPVIIQQSLPVPNPVYQPPGTFDVALEFWEPVVSGGAEKVASDTSSINLYPSCGSTGGEISGCVGATIGDCRIVNHPVSYVVSSPGRYTFTARCPDGEQMLGGGYRIIPEPLRVRADSTSTQPADFLSPLIIEASYPSAVNEWTVTVLSPYDSLLEQYMEAEHGNGDLSFYQLEESYAPEYVSHRQPTLVVDCYCFSSSVPDLGMQITQSTPTVVNYVWDDTTNNTGTEITCDAAPESVVTAGGFRTVPNFNEWEYNYWSDDFGPEYHSEVMDYLMENAFLLASTPTVDSSGQANGWRVRQHCPGPTLYGDPANHNFTTTSFALCATKGLISGACAYAPSMWRHDQNGDHTMGFDDVDGQIQCAPDAFTTGGGFEFFDYDGPGLIGPEINLCGMTFTLPHGIDTSHASDTFSGWDIHGLEEEDLLDGCFGISDPSKTRAWTVAVKLPPPQLAVTIVSPRDGDCIYADLKTSGYTGPVQFTAVTAIGCEEIDPALQWQLSTPVFATGQYEVIASWSGNNVSRVLSFPIGGMTEYCVTVTATHNGQSTSATACFSAGCIIY